ncbi:DUF4402 domain-containing protein [Parasphingopyxis lamellibrachiae]|uniref:Uncharacterized protein DUF4402 n=1 Tax=Parasphingopyxis lamellibrachiae TaxID=680125 RepID=A0A3D9FGY1_9SPHN|nr:DUF4402 domain-containing protein [Parasphingopyxis lamellibrachiae]RED17043.1 uncharacterized protein DUF4402 [Parasphingopyxis lamellibrachiae]
MKSNCFERRMALPAVAFLLLTTAPAYAASVDSNAETEILQPLTLTQISVLDFGSIVPGNVAGRINIRRNDGTCVAQGGAMLVGTNCQRGEFLITGPSRQRVRVTTAPAPITLSRLGGGASMTMDRVRINGRANKRLNAAGERTFYVSGRLLVGANQAEGVYDGTFDVTVDYR